MDTDFFIKQIDEIISDFDRIKSKSPFDDLSGVEVHEITAVITKSKAAVSRIAGINSEYYKDIEAILKRTNLWDGNKLKYLIGPVKALKSDIENGYLRSLNEIIRSEVFSDYLEMAEHLVNEGYKDPAAVLIGSTLESHLRELCKINSIDTEVENSNGNMVNKKADSLNSELTKQKVYSSAYQKQITAWLAIRNLAAHGRYDEYSNEEVKLMLQGIRFFMLSNR